MADATRNVEVRLKAATSSFNRQMEGAVGPRSAIGKLGIVAAGAAAAASVAVAGFAAASVKEFASLEKGMNEVFTLMPGLSDDAMGDMTQDVQDFAREMGVLPDEIVPALYDSISAGVPSENVFDFLKTANELAIGGVSDLNTAVDGLTSATNAYGVEQLSAADAADIMFTAVKQGKTTIDELARTVSETAPIAASLGVGFDETAASLAAMTAQGEPSQKAATKLRQAMAELGDAGKGAGKRFEQIAGVTFPEFIEGGGTLQEALQMLADDAESKGERVADAFGSIEAGMAATMLTSDAGREAMNANMTAMADRAGATQEAYEQMDQGIARTWERMKASLASFMTDIGERLGPVTTGILEGALSSFNQFADDVLAFLDTITAAWTGDWDDLAEGQNETVQRILGIAQELYDGISAAIDLIVIAVNTVLIPAWEAIEPLIGGVVNAVLTVIETTFAAISGVLEALVQLLSGDFTGAWNTMNDTVRTVNEGLRDTLTALWDGLMGYMQNLLGTTADAMQDRWREFRTTVETAATGLKDMLTRTWDTIRSTLERSTTGMRNAVVQTWTNLQTTVQDLWDRLTTFLQDTWAAARTTLQTTTDGISSGMVATWETLKATVTAIWQALRDWLVGLWEGAKAEADRIWQLLHDVIKAPVQALDTLLRTIFSGLEAFLTTMWNALPGVATTAFDGVRAGIEGALSGLSEWASGIFSSIVDSIGGMVASVRDSIQGAWDRLTGLFNRAEQAEAAAQDAERAAQEALEAAEASAAARGSIDAGGGADGGGGGGGGRSVPGMAAGGIVYEPTLALIGEAGPEAVVPLDRLGDLTRGEQRIVVELDGRVLSEAVVRGMPSVIRMSGA